MEVVAFHAIEQGEEIVMSCTSCYPASRKEKKKKKRSCRYLCANHRPQTYPSKHRQKNDGGT